MTVARSVRVRGVVQGVGFRPFVYRLARANALSGWVLNEQDGVDIHLEGAEPSMASFLRDLTEQAPTAAQITAVDVSPTARAGLHDFTIRESRRTGRPLTRISPDLPVCDECLTELFDPEDPRYQYPYINCTNCGPRYTVVESLPYDRAGTTMKHWPMDSLCMNQYHDPVDRRFHAQPLACPACGPQYSLDSGETGRAAVNTSARLLVAGRILAIKGIGGYHLACDAQNVGAVRALRHRKYRKEKPFAVMIATIEKAREIAHLTPEAEALLTSPARPIVLAPWKIELRGVTPDNLEIGLMLPYAPIHHLLFRAGAPEILVMTSGNRSSEPIAYEDDDARQHLCGIADYFLKGERPIARRVDDSVARAGVFGPAILRRSRGYAPGAAAAIPASGPLLAIGADLKNTITLAVGGQAFVSQHIGDLNHYDCMRSLRATVHDLTSMYDVNWEQLVIAYDLHPQYASTAYACELACARTYAVQHHRAHVASVLAEHEAWDKRVVGVSFDGTGYGDDGGIWGGEFFVGSIASGFERAMHLREAVLPGGDAAALSPVQCAAGFLAQMDGLPDVMAHPFSFPKRYRQAHELLSKQIRSFQTTSVGRLFDTAAALLGFTREISFEGQAAMWLEQLARKAWTLDAYPFPVNGNTLDFRPLLAAVAGERATRRDPSEIARAFQRGVARGLCDAVRLLCTANDVATVVLSGGVFQNEMLLADVKALLAPDRIQIWTNHIVPSNDGGISLGQAAIAAFASNGAGHA
jgi:hydrogenase maturation protein HypF